MTALKSFGQNFVHALKEEPLTTLAITSTFLVGAGLGLKYGADKVYGWYEHTYLKPKFVSQPCRDEALQYVAASVDDYLLRGENPNVLERYEQCLKKDARE